MIDQTKIDETQLMLCKNIGQLAEDLPRLPARTLRALFILSTVPNRQSIARVFKIAETHWQKAKPFSATFVAWFGVGAPASALLELLPEDPPTTEE